MNLVELLRQTGITAKWVAGTAGGEYHSACPACGGRDRFFIQPHRQMNRCLGSYRCRKCGIYGDSLNFATEFLKYPYHQALELLGSSRNDLHNYRIHAPTPIPCMIPPRQEWITKATELVSEATENLLLKPDVLNELSLRGISHLAIAKYKLGWIPKSLWEPRADWGLEHEQGSMRKIWIPEGILIPSLDKDGKVIRMKVRRANWHNGDNSSKYIAISGSMNGLTLTHYDHRETIVVVESELDALAIDYAVGDLVTTVAVGSCLKNPDNITHRKALKAKQIIICHDNDAAGNKMFEKWKRLYPQAKKHPTPIGKDIGEAIEQGLNIGEWMRGIILS